MLKGYENNRVINSLRRESILADFKIRKSKITFGFKNTGA